ncbi:hypothetical protein VDGL01_04904 [Verticillium dahliae]
MADRQQRALPASRPAHDSDRRPAPVALPAFRLRNNHVPEPQPPERMRLESCLLGRKPVHPPSAFLSHSGACFSFTQEPVSLSPRNPEKSASALQKAKKRSRKEKGCRTRLEAAVERARRRRQRPQLRGRGGGALLGRQHAVEEARAAGPRQETEDARDLANVGANVEGQWEVARGFHRMGATASMSGAAQ